MYIAVYLSVGGWKPCLYDEQEGPIQTGFGYPTPQMAYQAAIEWGKDEGIRVEKQEFSKCDKHPDNWRINGHPCDECFHEDMVARFARKSNHG